MLAALALALTTEVAAASGPAPLHLFDNLALSPDGQHVATSEADDPQDLSRTPHHQIVVRQARDGAVERVYDPCPVCTYGDVAFSPDGSRLAYIARDKKTAEVSVHIAAGASDQVAASFKGVAEKPRWSPDGALLALKVVVNAKKSLGATSAGAAQVGDIGSDPDEARIAVVPAAGGQMRLVSPADTFIYEYDWTADGKGFVASAAKGDGDNNWWVAELAAVDLSSGQLRRIAKPERQLNFPRSAPDGKSVAYIGGLMSDFGPVGGDIYLAPFAGGAAEDITPGFKGSFTSLAWRGGRLLATALVGDQTEIISLDPKTRRMTTLWSAPLGLSSGEGKVAFDAAGKIGAATVSDFEHAPEIAAAPIKDLGLARRITRANAALPAFAKATSVHWINEGFTIQGWLLAPLNVAPGKTYPLVVQVHGGPSSAVTPNYLRPGMARTLLAHGYYVFLPNPRGSYGQGEAFTRANVRDFGGGDLRDILAGVDAVEKIAPVDEQRLGVMGHSYGGFMTMWTLTQTHRFKAAVAGAGIANWISYYGENGIDQWMIPFFGGSAYDDPAIYQKLSPLTHIKAATTPVFLYVGERDVECPASQSVEYWHALRDLGVPVRLLILAGEGHGIREPEHEKAINDGALAWFDKYLGGGK
jgi:dipeptidyl aminopeptidase/acylaminoacyl peptidase